MPCCLPLARAASLGSIAICLEWLNWNIFLKFLCSVPSWKMPEYCFSFLGFSFNCWSIQSFLLLLVFQPSLFQTGWHTGSNLCELNIVICSPAAACQALKWQQFLSKKITKISLLQCCSVNLLWITWSLACFTLTGSKTYDNSIHKIGHLWCFTAFPFYVCSIWHFFLFFFLFMQSPNAGDKDDQTLTVGSN